MGKTSQIKKLEGVITGLVRELEQLAPHPDHISFLVPVSLGRVNSISGNFNYNGMLMHAYLNDMPRRMGLQRRIAAARRRISMIHNAHADSLVLAA